MAIANSSTSYQRTWVHYLAALEFVLLAGIAASEMSIRSPHPGFRVAFDRAVSSLTYEGVPVLANYTGIEGVDKVLRMLVIAFMPGTVGPNQGFQLLQAYFLISFFPIISIFCVESGRKGNRWSLISFPVLYGFFYQTIGGAIVIPCYYLAHVFTVARRSNYDYFSASSMTVPTAFAKALVPSLLLGYLLPTILLYVPYFSTSSRQGLIAFWQPVPLWVSILLQVFTWLFSNSRDNDIVSVSTVHGLGCLVSVAAHLLVVGHCVTSRDPAVSLGNVFDPRLVASGSVLISSLKYIFQVDFWVIFTASLLWAYLTIYDLKLAGMTQIGMLRALGLLILGTIAFGPAAAVSGTCYWRELLLENKNMRKVKRGE